MPCSTARPWPAPTASYIYPSRETTLDITATLFPRQTITNVGVAPLTSMYFEGENDRKRTDDFRPELHDSDGLLMHSGRRRVDLAPPAQSGQEDDLVLQRQQSRAASA